MKRSRRSSGGDANYQKATENGVSNSSYISQLPIVVAHEIFFKLPIKSVMRCRCVCTAWYNFLSEPIFSQNYAKNSTFTSLLHCKDPRTINSSSKVLYLLEISDSGEFIRAPINPKLPGWLKARSSLFVIGSSNGLLCYRVHKPGAEVIYVGNPIMGDSIALPERERDPQEQRIVIYKFEFSPSTNNFKVLRIAFKSWVDAKIEECEIFTVGVDDEWRCLPNPFTNLNFLTEVIAFHGAFHWIPQDEGPVSISTFDLAEEKTDQILMPSGLVLVSRAMNLAVFNNQLSLVDYSVPSQITIWTMKKYPVLESWTKVVVLRSWFPSVVHFCKIVPVAESHNGDLLFSYSANTLISRDMKQKKCTFFGVHCVGRVTSSSIISSYSPTFSSFMEMKMKGLRSTVNGQLKEFSTTFSVSVSFDSSSNLPRLLRI